jgi:EAL domain-containing protein (putative c-di-GMP-specific phosphodiesterase class I)
MINILAAGLDAAGLVEGGAVIGPALELGRGAIAGAFIVAAAFLAGYAAIRRSGLAVCALLMVVAAAALEFSWLGFFASMPSEMAVLIQGVFAAAAIVFLSASVGAARYNPLLGGVMFTAALIIGGMGLINFVDRIDVAPLMRLAVFGVGGFAIVLVVTQAIRGDAGARLILPGVALAAAAPLFGPLAGIDAAGFTLAPHGLFTLGVVAASLVALTEGAAPRGSAFASAGSELLHGFAGAGQDERTGSETSTDHGGADSEELDLGGQLARVLDYSGVAIWDWSHDSIDQTDSLPSLLGADSTAPFTPEALRNFIHKDDAARFKAEVLTPVDGPFDVALKLYDGRKVRLRGARAAHEGSGELERLVAFIETASPIFTPSANSGVDGKKLQKATEAAVVPAAANPASAKFVEALEKGDIVAAFQPVVSLSDKKVAGYEALARWPDQDNGADEGPETFVKYAEAAGKGGALAQAMLSQAAAFLADKLKTEKRDDLFVTMNVSWSQISAAGFVSTVRDTVKKYSLPKNSLVLELTEGDAVSDDAAASKIFKSLKDAGVSLAFDDFGAGFSCLSNLQKYSFDYLKIDKSFTSDLESGGVGAKIVRSLASLGKDLGLKVIIEGVESEAAAKTASEIGCAYGQGYALGKPVQIKGDGNRTRSKKQQSAKSDNVKALKNTKTETVEEMPASDKADFSEEKKPIRWSLLRR